MCPELRNLTRRVQGADAALTALSNYRHDGRPLPGAERVLAKALAAAIEAGELAKHLLESKPKANL